MTRDLEQDTDTLEQQLHEARMTDKRQKWGLFILSMLLMVALAVIGLLLVQAWERADRSEDVAVAEQEQKKEVAQEAQEALCGQGDRQIYDRDLCAKWAEIAEEPAPADPGPSVVVGGPSQEDIIAAFREYCAAGNCRGADGAPPTPDDIAAAFARFCAGGSCRGADGEDAPPAVDGKNGVDGVDGVDGKNGVDGQDGADATPEMVFAAVTTVCAEGACVGPQGPEGPPPTPEAIAGAVAAFCADGACRGPQGEPGPAGAAGADSTVPGPAGANGATGETGAPGRGIASVQCDSPTPFSFNITYSDGTTETAQCGGVPPAEPPLLEIGP